MADTNQNAITTLSGDGTTLNFTLAWPTSAPSSSGLPYLDESHILVETPIGTTKTLANHYNLSADGLSVEFTSGNAPASGTDNLRFTRVTPHSSLFVTFTDSAPATAANFIDAYCQCIYYTEEVEDQI